mgnify:CR=1 FL=1
MLIGVDRRQMVLDYISLPVLNGSVSLDLLCLQVNIFYIHAGILSEITELDLVEFLCE